MTIPVSLLNDFAYLFRDGPAAAPQKVVLLMRHSVRFPILTPADTYVVGLTEEGVLLAEKLGETLGRCFSPGRLRSSPIGRCRATAEAMARGAGWPGKVRADKRLSHPFIAPAWYVVEHGGPNGVLPEPILPLLRWMFGAPELALGEVQPRLDVLVTHDTVLGALVNCLLCAPVLGPEYWPDYLEGVFAWRAEGYLHLRWRGVEQLFTEQFVKVESE
jgi:hypothetical protein